MINFLLRHLELVFTLAGLLVISSVTWLLHPTGVDSAMVAAVTAIAVGAIHGLLFWVVRYRQRLVRRQTLFEIKRMLRDVVINQLAVVRIGAELHHTAGAQGDTKAAVLRMETAIATIDQALNDLSEESLARWHARYDLSRPPFA